jgi:hypothetical protein
LTIVDQQLEGCASAVAKEKERTGERIVVEAVAAQCGERIDALTESAIRSSETDCLRGMDDEDQRDL